MSASPPASTRSYVSESGGVDAAVGVGCTQPARDHRGDAR